MLILRGTVVAIVTPAAAAIAAAPAGAQAIDHGALEQLFGEPVTTSATGQPQRASNAPANMVIISAEDIRRSGARDIPGVLRHVGGVDILQWTSGHTDVGVRGYDREFSSRLLVLIDGRQVYADHFGYVPWSVLPVELGMIRQIEVVKGPNSALFGFNAVGGVINIVTYDPELDDVDGASAFVGTQNLSGGSAFETFQLGERAAVRLSVGAHRGDEFTTPVPSAMGTGREDDDERVAVSADGVFKLSDRVRLRLEATHAEAIRNDVKPKFSIADQDYQTSSLQARLSADTHAGLLEGTVYTNWIGVDDDTTGLVPGLRFDNQVTVARLQDLFTLGSAHTFRATAEYRHNTVNTTSEGGADVFYDIIAFGGMWNWKISPALSLTNAVRIDHLELGRDGAIPSSFPFTNEDWDRDLDETSFNAGLVWRASENDTVRVLAARGVQLPNLTRLGAIQLFTPFFNVIGRPDAGTSTVTSYEIDWDHDIAPLNATLRATVFHQWTENVESLEGGLIVTPGRVYQHAINFGESCAQGLEIGLKGEIDGGWRWGVDYRAERVDDDFEPLSNGQNSSTNYEDTTPEHLVNANIGWSGGRWEVDGYLRHQSDASGVLIPSRVTGPELTPIDAYTAIDGRVAYALTEHATFAISGQNLGEPEQRQTSGPEVERRVMGTLTLRY